jgi:hypothetical protein
MFDEYGNRGIRMDHEEEFGQSLYPDDFSVSRKMQPAFCIWIPWSHGPPRADSYDRNSVSSVCGRKAHGRVIIPMALRKKEKHK